MAATYKSLQGLAMELKDCASPLLQDVIVTEDQDEVY